MLERALYRTPRSRRQRASARRFVRNVSVSATHIPQVKTADGLVTYLVHGFKRGDHNLHISVLIDAPEFSGRAFELAEEIAGSDYCFHASENCSVPIPDEIKNKLLSSEELYAVVPELDPHRHQRRVAR
jgi:hypothetical protein